MIETTHLLILGAVVALGLILLHGRRYDPREPPMVTNGIPIVGHAFGLLWNGVGHWGDQAKKHRDKPIIGLDMLVNKFYVVTSPDLVQAVQRNSKTLTFSPLLLFSAKSIAGIKNPKSLHILRDKDAGGEGLGLRIMHSMIPTLVGKPLDKLNIHMIRLIQPFIEQLSQTSTFDLYGWCKDATMAASTEATYGPLNPYADKKIQDLWWDFEGGLGLLLPNIWPSLLARKPYYARQQVADAVYKYTQADGHKQASELANVRFKATMGSGLSLEEYCLLEVSMLLAFVSNTVPAMFWCMFDFHSRPQLLEELRQEIELNALRVADDGSHSIDLTSIREKCPLLLSAFQEVLRFRSNSSPMRIVIKDTLLADKYLLKAGNSVNMPSIPLAQHPDVWGESQAVFDERRFMSTGDKQDGRRTGGFMTFGVSPTVCPGRHFASSEILLLVAMVMLRYDLEPVGGVWKEPPKVKTSMVSITGPVKGKFPVKPTLREKYAGVKWGFHVEEGKGQFPLAIG